MRTITFCLWAGLLLAFMAAPASAAVYFEDDFESYSAGALPTTGNVVTGYNNFSGSVAAQVIDDAGNNVLELDGDPGNNATMDRDADYGTAVDGSGGSVRRFDPANGSADDVYYAYDLTLLTQPGSGGTWITNLFTTAGFDSTGKLWVQSDGSGYNIGTTTQSNGPAAFVQSGGSNVIFSLNTTYRVVLGMVTNGNGSYTAQVWVDPSSASEAAHAEDTDARTTTVEEFTLRQSDSFGGFGVARLDNIQIGSTLDDVIDVVPMLTLANQITGTTAAPSTTESLLVGDLSLTAADGAITVDSFEMQFDEAGGSTAAPITAELANDANDNGEIDAGEVVGQFTVSGNTASISPGVTIMPGTPARWLVAVAFTGSAAPGTSWTATFDNVALTGGMTATTTLAGPTVDVVDLEVASNLTTTVTTAPLTGDVIVGDFTLTANGGTITVDGFRMTFGSGTAPVSAMLYNDANDNGAIDAGEAVGSLTFSGNAGTVGSLGVALNDTDTARWLVAVTLNSSAMSGDDFAVAIDEFAVTGGGAVPGMITGATLEVRTPEASSSDDCSFDPAGTSATLPLLLLALIGLAGIARRTR